MEHDERYEVRNADAERALRTLATMIDEQIPDGMGFGLFLYDFGAGGAMFWISNGQRADMINALKEWIAKNEKET